MALAGRFLGAERARRLFEDYARGRGAHGIDADARLVQFAETAARRRHRQRLGPRDGGLGGRGRGAGHGRRDAHRRGGLELRAYSKALEKATDELRHVNEQLKSLDRLKDDFMSSVTHELRTPLTSIRALAELMGDDAEMPAAQRQQFLGIMVAETERLSRLVNQVLDMAKIESGHADWHNTEVDLVALLQQAAQTVRRCSASAVPCWNCNCRPHARRCAPTPTGCMQVLLNLLSNAAKFVPSPGGRIVLRLRVDAAGATVEVQDNGPGVPEAQRALIFEKFRQGGDAEHRPQGTGLGLPISRQIVEHFGGRMELRPDIGQGACFAFTLPWTRSTEPARDRAAAATAGDPPMTSRILIADDEPNILISLEYLMKREGYEVHVARDGQEALDVMQRERPRLVLLDVMMPGKTGFEVCQAVRADEALKGTLVLMLTAKGRDTDVARGLGVGADAYMTKPFSTQELTRKVRELLAAPPRP